PKMFGKGYDELWAKIGFWIVFAGFNLTFFIQFVAGSQGMPRRYADYPDQYWIHHFHSTLGAYVLGIGLFIVLGVWIHSLLRGKQAPANPWGANSLEWHTASPPPHENFAKTPIATDPYDYTHWKYDEKLDGYVLEEGDTFAATVDDGDGVSPSH
ncbi:MAG: cbb3-type cytochrome c oxidase subunit I, partial [Rhodospirillales bacterium]|nr:cbb3-type cytochrome c oxidase subunit I [Rhodospirillales bacterium]